MRKYLRIDHAQSINNGICFYSKRHKGYVSVATIDENDTINVEWTTTQKLKTKAQKIANFKKMLIFAFCAPFVASGLALLLDWATNYGPMFTLRTFLISCSLMHLLPFFVISTIRRKNKDTFKFHSAEHMVINAYTKLNRIPSLEEIRQYSRFDNTCGTNLTTLIVLNCLATLACTFIPNVLFMKIGIVLAPIVAYVLLEYGYLNFLQFFTTIPPTDRELIVAIAGMSVWLFCERKEAKQSKFSKFIRRLFPRVFN